jgi:predicted nucleic acid-binding protein
MSAIRRRPAALIAGLAVLGSVLTACGSGSTQANSAVIIGKRVISVDEVQQRLDTALSKEQVAKDLAKNHKLDLVSRGIVSTLVLHELIVEQVRRDGLSVSEKDVADFLARAAPAEDPVQRAVDAGFDAKELARDRLLLQTIGNKYLDKLQITFDGALLTSPANAKATALDLANKLAAEPNRSAELLKAASGGGANQDVSPVTDQKFDPIGAFQLFDQRQLLLKDVFGVAAGNVVAFGFDSGGDQQQGGISGWLVALVKNRITNATLPAEEVSLAAQVPPGWSQTIAVELVSPLTTELGLQLNPRYGVWDQLAAAVVPSEAEKVGLIKPAATKTP